MGLGASTQGKLPGPLAYLDLGEVLRKELTTEQKVHKGKRRLTIRKEEAGWEKEEVTDTNRSTKDQRSREGSWRDCSASCGQIAGTVRGGKYSAYAGQGKGRSDHPTIRMMKWHCYQGFHHCLGDPLGLLTT